MSEDPGYLWMTNPVEYSVRKAEAHEGEIQATRGWDADHQPPHSVHREGDDLWVVTPNWVHRFVILGDGEIIPLMDNLVMNLRMGHLNYQQAVGDTPRIPKWPTDYDPDKGGPWGGFSNGRIPEGELASIGGGHLLRADAAADFNAMSTAYGGIPITDAYRTYQEQVVLKRTKPHLAATPGTSNHGWGLAVDLGTGSFGSPLYNWLADNAATYGWFQPAWAQASGSKPEHWHWEYEG